MIAERLPAPLRGNAAPRLAPPIPVASLAREFEAAAKALKIKAMPWQSIAARYMTAVAGKRWQYREVCIVVARQNGKTELLLPRIRLGLERGRRMLHTAQNRSLPRETFLRVAQALNGHPDVLEIRYANGQEVIKMANGGRYSLVAPRPGARGNAVDDVFLDEVREYKNFDLIAAIKPTMTAARDPQIIYLSNAGDAESVVLNDLRRRSETDPNLCYLEWSASPERAIDDRDGWAEANPALGITIEEATLATEMASLPPYVFETEHLCRWVSSMQPRLVSTAAWELCRGKVDTPTRPTLGISMDPSGKRASAVMAWQMTDGRIACVEVKQAKGDPIAVDILQADLREEVIRKYGVRGVAYASWTDTALAKAFPTAKALDGKEFANASENFARVVSQGRLVWETPTEDHLSEELNWTTRKPHDSGAWMAAPAMPDKPITTVLAAIRAVWYPSLPKRPPPRIG